MSQGFTPKKSFSMETVPEREAPPMDWGKVVEDLARDIEMDLPIYRPDKD